ncbi:SWPV1-025 [Shearwaterpox virus]|uniref:SWPV1-025 n=1 Tax=Shearwaterpox virus TaxID=1974596 RepID=A0A1V0S7N8_CNPV|nr:SWPV1-025 [Shearwaterpox virus]
MSKFIFLLLLFSPYLSNSYKMVVYNGIRINMTCILPPDKHADKLVLVKGNLKSNSFMSTIKIDNAGEERVCYCGDPPKEYKIELPNNVSVKDDGSYRCIFYYNSTETFRHKIELSVMPEVSVRVEEDSENKRRYFIINATRSLEQDKISIKPRAGGVELGDYPLNNIKYTETYEDYKITANTNYDDCAGSVIFSVSYMGLSRDFVASIDDNIQPGNTVNTLIIGNNLGDRIISKYSKF